SFALLGATVSLHRRPRGQARSGQDGKGAGNIGRWCGTSTMVRAAGAWTWTALLGRWPADDVVRSNRSLCYGHWRRWFGGSPVGWVRRTGPAGGRAEVRPPSQTDRVRSRWHGEAAPRGLPADERAQAPARIQDRRCRRGHARTPGMTEHLLES